MASRSSFLALLLASLTSTFAACAAPTDHDEALAEAEEALRALSPAEIVGTLAYGETSAPVPYTKAPLYRAFAFEGKKGDPVDAWVRSTDGDARAWLVTGSFKTIATNLDAAPGTKDARVQATLTEGGTHYVVFRESARKDATFAVALAKAAGACALAPAITPKWEDGAQGRPHGPVVFDSKRSRLVVLGAGGASELVAGGWSPPTGDPLPAGRRAEASIAYDSDRGRAVLFGGTDANNGLLGDTWEWDGATGAWTQITPPGLAPRARRGHALVYDAARKKTVLYGGYAGNTDQDAMRDTWTWDGATWTRVGTQAQPHPEPRYGHHMAYDAARGVVVLYGQYGGWYVGPIGQPNSASGNTWEWDGAAWTPAPNGGGTFSSDDPTSLPMAYDARRGRVVRVDMQGGRYRKEFTVLEWTGGGWSKISPDPGPSVDIASATSYVGAYDPTRGRFLLGSSGYDWKTKELLFFEEPNRAPALAKIADVRAFAGEQLAFAIDATDPDGHAVRYDVTPLPAGATIDPQLGAFRWQPTVAQAGTYTLTAKAADGCAESSRAFTIKVDHLGYASLPNGAVKLGGKVKVPALLSGAQRGFEVWPELPCVVAGDNPGKVTVTCESTTASGYAYPGYSASVTTNAVSAPLEADMKFAFKDASTSFAGSLEPLSDGTFKLHINAFAQQTVSGPLSMRTSPPYGTTDAYGVVDVIP
jgi:hypothetical protein